LAVFCITSPTLAAGEWGLFGKQPQQCDPSTGCCPTTPANAPRLCYWGATWCGPCHRVKPIARKYYDQGYNIEFGDADANRKIYNMWKITAVPTIIVYENDGADELYRYTGEVTDAQFKAILDTFQVPQVPRPEPKQAAMTVAPPIMQQQPAVRYYQMPAMQQPVYSGSYGGGGFSGGFNSGFGGGFSGGGCAGGGCAGGSCGGG